MSKKIDEIERPSSGFSFTLKIGTQVMAYFSTISGLDLKIQPIEYRHGDNQAFSTPRFPGIAKNSNAILNRGLILNKNYFSKWMDAQTSLTFRRETAVIELLDQTGKLAMSWTLTNAFPIKISACNFNSAEDIIAVESLELAYEELVKTAK